MQLIDHRLSRYAERAGLNPAQYSRLPWSGLAARLSGLAVTFIRPSSADKRPGRPPSPPVFVCSARMQDIRYEI
jgi:hypothetical protein